MENGESNLCHDTPALGSDQEGTWMMALSVGLKKSESILRSIYFPHHFIFVCIYSFIYSFINVVKRNIELHLIGAENYYRH